MVDLRAFLVAEIGAGRRFFPPADRVFNAMALTPFDAVRVVILGQDPYHGAGSGDGALLLRSRRAFRSRPRCRTSSRSSRPTSALPRPSTGDLTPWAERGVLLLNAVLTVSPAQAGLPRRQRLGALHRPRDRASSRRAARASCSCSGVAMPSRRGTSSTEPPSRSHGLASVPVQRGERVLRLPPLLAGKRAARGGRPRPRRLGALVRRALRPVRPSA